jgi:hypothetical protein
VIRVCRFSDKFAFGFAFGDDGCDDGTAMGGIDFDASGVVDVVGFGLSVRDVDVGIDMELDSVLVGIKAELDEADTCTGPNSGFETNAP